MSFEGQSGGSDGKHVYAPQAEGDLAQLGDPHPARPGSTDERAHARPDDPGGAMAALEERLNHADMGEPLHPAAAQYEGERCIAFHSLIRLPGGLSPE